MQYIWDETGPMADMLVASGLFGTGASGDIADDAPLQTRMLDLFGRRP